MLTQKAGWSGSACLSVSETVAISASSCLNNLSRGRLLSECRVSCDPRWAHGQEVECDVRSLAAVHLGSGLGQSWKVNRTVSAVLLDVEVSISCVDGNIEF